MLHAPMPSRPVASETAAALAPFVADPRRRELAGAAACEPAHQRYSADAMVWGFYRVYGIEPLTSKRGLGAHRELSLLPFEIHSRKE